MKRIVIGILPQDKLRQRVIAIARGQYRPKPGEPKIWFPSMKSVAETLSDKNLQLIRVIAEHNPGSIAELSRRTGRAPGNLSRTLHRLARYGFIVLERRPGNILKPIVRAVEYDIRAIAA